MPNIRKKKKDSCHPLTEGEDSCPLFWTEVLTHSTSHTAKSAEAMAPALFHTCSVTDIAPVLITS